MPAVARRSQAERRAESDRRLLQATAELVVERGIDGASLVEIGRRAGYSHGLVNHRFGSKEALIERLNGAAVQLFTEATNAAVRGRQGLVALKALADVYLGLVQGQDPVARVHLVVWSETVANASVRQVYRNDWDRYFRRTLSELIAGGIAEGSVRADADPASAAVLVLGMLRGVALQLMLDPGAASAAAVRGAVAEHLTAMLQPCRQVELRSVDLPVQREG